MRRIDARELKTPLVGAAAAAVLLVALGSAAHAGSAWFNGSTIDFHGLYDTLASINENAPTGVLFVMDQLPEAPSPLCFMGFDCSM